MTDRFELLETECMTQEQKLLAQEVLNFSLRGLQGPFNMLLRSPKAARRLMALGDYLRSDTPVPLALAELAILIHARCWNDNYEWALHRPRSLEAGITEQEVNRIGQGRMPDFSDDRKQAVFDFCVGLCLERKVSDEVFERTRSLFGEALLTDLTLIMGQYATVSMIISVSATKAPQNSDVSPLAMLDAPPFRERSRGD